MWFSDVSKHFFISLYIISFFLGIVLITMNHVYISKTKDASYIKLQYYNWAFLTHIMMNFIYFYGLYFWEVWKVKDYILLVVNAGYVVFVFSLIYMLKGFSGIKIPHGKVILLSSSIFYVYTFFLIYEEAKIFAQNLFWNKTLIIFLASITFLLLSVLFCCVFLLSKWIRQKPKYRKDYLIPIFCIALIAYTSFNAYVDISFCFFIKRTDVWGINVYNLTIIFYLILNSVSIPLLYRRESFINAISGKNDEAAFVLITPTLIPTSSISEFACNYHLTLREVEIVSLICQGKNNPDISNSLFISNNTVKHHVNSIFKKTGVKNRYELISNLKNIKN